LQDATYPMPPPPPPPPPPPNPYAAPIAPYATGSSGSQVEAERIRHDLGPHEANVRALGLIYLTFSILFGLAALGLLAATLMGQLTTPDAGPIPWFGVAGVVALGCWLYYWIGSGLRALRPYPRVGAIVISGLGVLGFPLGTLIHGYFLYLLVSDKGKKVFSPEYQLVIAATPHLKFQSRWMLGCFVILLVLGAIFALTIVFSSP
jgi:hypothetical protein